MTAFEVVADTFIDECQIEIVENPSIPNVLNERNPFHFQIDYRNGVWSCEGFYQCKETPDEFVTIRRGYSAEMVAALSTFYLGEEEESDDVPDVVDDCTLQSLRIMGGHTES